MTKNEYFYKVQKDLEYLGKNLKLIPGWKIEVEVITQKMSAYRNGSIPFPMGFASNKTIKIDDILEMDEARINFLKSNIENTEFELNIYKPYIELLNDNEKEVINRKYLDVKNQRTSYEKIGENMNCGARTVKRWHDSAIEKIADYMYKYIDKIERYKNDIKMT